MIYLQKGKTENVILTLTEKQLLTSPNYLFIFTNRTSNYDVRFVLTNNKDTSQYKDRYNKFSIKVDSYFATKLTGQWDYDVYEQTSNNNTDPKGLNLLESGIMFLKDEEKIYKEYETSDKYKIRK